MTNLVDLLKYVRTGTAEGDKHFLSEVFVTPAQFDQLCGVELGGMRLLVGNKGMGKTAILEWIARAARARKIPCVLIRPDDIAQTNQPAENDLGSLKRHYYDVLIRTIGIQIGSQLQGLLTGEKATLYTEARRAGATPEDIVQKSLNLLTAIAVPVAGVNGAQLAKELLGIANSPTLIRAINTQLLAQGRLFLLLIDDTDQIASPGTPSHLNRIWALILAVRRLTNECPSVRGMVSLRSEVWARLTSESYGQRDQTDHVRGLVVALKADETLMKNIVRKRLDKAAVDGGVRGRDPYTIFFKGSSVLLPGTDEKRSWDDFIVKSARDRPRDSIQLIKNMIDEAIRNGSQIIGSDEASKAMQGYSSERVDDLTNEFALDCPSIREIINTFVNVPFDADFETLREHLRTVPSYTSVTIRGKTIRQNNDEESVLLLSLLHESGFLNPRINDSRQPRGFRHLLFLENPHFVKISNWNEMQSATWEVHPAFRTYLIGAKRDHLARATRTGAPR